MRTTCAAPFMPVDLVTDAAGKGPGSGNVVTLKAKCHPLKDMFPSKAWHSNPERGTLLAFQLQTDDGVAADALVGDGRCVCWKGRAEFKDDAVLRIMGLRYHEKAEGYHSIINFHLHNEHHKVCALREIEVLLEGEVTVKVEAEALEHPDETGKAIAEARRESLNRFDASLPSDLKRIVINDGLMHCLITRHHDPHEQAMPSWHGLPTVSDISAASARKILDDMVGICRDCVPDDADDATLVAVGLSMHSGMWSVEQLDDRELTMMLGEDCDDMVIRARSVFEALKRHLGSLHVEDDFGRRICRFIRRHQMLSCQGHASPPHPLKEPGQVIGHVYGLFVNDCDWQSQWNLETGVPKVMTSDELRRVWNPSLCEATAPCRAIPCRPGHVFKKVPGLVEIRTAKGDESYRSLQQVQTDDGVVYFFEDDGRGRWVGGVNANVVLCPPTEAVPDRKICMLLMRADPSLKTRSDSKVILNEADPAVLEMLYQKYRALMAREGVVIGEIPSSCGPTRYHLSSRFFSDTSCSFRY